MTDVFISYSHENREAARILAEVISAKGYDVWWDRELIAGDNYTDVIEQVIDEAKAVIVIWSDASRKSYWVRDEAAVGRDRNRLIPVSIDTNPPPLGFRQIHTVSLNGWDGQDESWLEDIFLGLKGLTARKDEIEAHAIDQTVASTNPFGAPVTKLGNAPNVAQMFAGVNARPNQKSIKDIKAEEKRQRSFMKTFWLTSFVLGGLLSLILGLYANETDSFSGDHWLINVAAASIIVGSGLVCGRLLIAVGRRFSKRKSIRYFDHPTTISMIASGVCSAAVFLAFVQTTTTTQGETASDSLFMALLSGLVFFFPLFGFVSLVIGVAKGRKRTSFEDGK